MGASTNLSDHDLLIEIHTNVKRLVDDSADHETRIRALEKFHWKSLGLGAAGGLASGGTLAAIIAKALA